MRIALAGLAALAVAMGVGRFAFTPLLPMMQADSGLSLAAGGWLASANYLGYLLGALSAGFVVRSPLLIRIGLLAIAATTLAMGFTHQLVVWAALRLAAGIASAWVLVHVSAWCLPRLRFRLHHPGHLYPGDGARGDRRPGGVRLGVAGLRSCRCGVDARRRSPFAALHVPAFMGGEPARYGAVSRRAAGDTGDRRHPRRGALRRRQLHGGHHGEHAGSPSGGGCAGGAADGRHDRRVRDRADPGPGLRQPADRSARRPLRSIARRRRASRNKRICAATRAEKRMIKDQPL